MCEEECLNIARISLHFNKHIREVNILPFKYLCVCKTAEPTHLRFMFVLRKSIFPGRNDR